MPLAALLLVTACSTIEHQRVDGWPQLEIVEHYVPYREMQERCVRYVGFGMAPEACAEFDLPARKCHIWYSADPPCDGCALQRCHTSMTVRAAIVLPKQVLGARSVGAAR